MPGPTPRMLPMCPLFVQSPVKPVKVPSPRSWQFPVQINRFSGELDSNLGSKGECANYPCFLIEPSARCEVKGYCSGWGRCKFIPSGSAAMSALQLSPIVSLISPQLENFPSFGTLTQGHT